MGSTMGENGGSSAASAPRTPTKRSKKALGKKKGDNKSGGANDGSTIASSHNETTQLTMTHIHRSPRAKSTSTFQRPTQLQSATVWDVISPPPVNSVKGHFIPSTLAKYHRHRRVSVEVHRVLPAVKNVTEDDDKKKKEEAESAASASASAGARKKASAAAGSDSSAPAGPGLLSSISKSARTLVGSGVDGAEAAGQGYEECFVRILVPASPKEVRAAQEAAEKIAKDAKRVVGEAADRAASVVGGPGGALLADDDSLVPGPMTAVNSKPGRTASTTSGMQHGNVISLDNIPEEESLAVAPAPPVNAQWLEKYRFPLRDVQMKKRVSNSVVLHTKLGEIEQTREVIFESEREAIAFCTEIEEHTRVEEIRRKKRLKAALGGIKIRDDKEKIKLLIEVVSGTDLPAADLLSSDPMVKILFNGREIHKTKFIPSTLEPVWTIKTHSLCLFSVTIRDLFDTHDGLTFVVQDYDKFGGNENLGAVVISPREVFTAKGERLEYPLKPLFGEKDYGKGKLAVRIRRATEYDVDFMEKWNSSQKEDLMVKTTASKGGKGTIGSVMTRNEKIEKHGHGAEKVAIKKYKIRPGHDPKRKDETTWMTKEALQEEALKPSQRWIDVGSGKLGKLHLEIIGCDGLPQLDTGGFLGNKTDAFVSIVYEDCISKTDVIDDTLSPRWMPWSQRAYQLHMMHPSSQLFLGVFDYDEGMFDDHDLIGRASVDVTNFYPDTEYLLTYNIYPTAKTSYTREAQGTLTFRLRIEYYDERKLVLTNLEPPPTIHVNVKNKKDFHCSRYTASGKIDMEPYSQRTISSYIEELMTYMEIYYYLEDALMNVLLWRGHFPLKLGKHTILLPVHSFNLFLCMVTLVEKPTLYPSFCCVCIAWVLLAVMGYKRNAVNPWDRCRSLGEVLQQLILGKATTGPDDIKPYENAEAAEEFTRKWQERLEDAEKLAEKRRQSAIKEQEEWQKEMEEIGDTNVDISTKTGGVGVSIDPLKPILYPIQQYLAIICNVMRFVKNVIIWEESYFAAIISLASIVLAVALAFVPWVFIIRWTSRIIVWTIFGPWMKAVDVFYVSKITPLTEKEMEEQEHQARMLRKERTKAAALQAKIAREDAQKLKAMKKYMFGKFITHVSVLKLDRFRDIPLPCSSATPYEQKSLPMSELAMKEAGKDRTRIPGQHLVGDMIPKLDTDDINDAPTGQPTAQKSLLDKSSPGATVEKDSTANAVGKIAGVVAAAAIVTWFGVPLMIAAVKMIW